MNQKQPQAELAAIKISLKPQPLLAIPLSKFQMASEPDESSQQVPGKPMDANHQNVFNALKTTYWKAAHKEICTMILFFGDVLDQGRKVDNFLAMDFAEMKCDNFTKMFDLWRKFMLKSPQKTFSQPFRSWRPTTRLGGIRYQSIVQRDH